MNVFEKLSMWNREPGPIYGLTNCDQCTRGWIPDGDWYKACPICKGSGVLTIDRLAKLLGVAEATVKGFWTGRRRTRLKTTQKILDKVCALLEPQRAKQLKLGEHHEPSAAERR
jgi:hypothetical protein